MTPRFFFYHQSGTECLPDMNLVNGALTKGTWRVILVSRHRQTANSDPYFPHESNANSHSLLSSPLLLLDSEKALYDELSGRRPNVEQVNVIGGRYIREAKVKWGRFICKFMFASVPVVMIFYSFHIHIFQLKWKKIMLICSRGYSISFGT